MADPPALARLTAAGVPDPARDLRRLEAAAPDAATLARWVARRARREPVSHILGRRAFWTLEFEVGADVLDPRPETETLVAAALEAMLPDARILDLGTGSGCVLISLLHERPSATGVGTDLSEPALAVATRNAQRAGVAARAAFRHADWFAGLANDMAGKFDLIVSNPPYIAEAEMDDLSPEVRLWEPRLALTPGGDGLDAYRAIAAGAARHLRPGGRILLEIGPTQAQAVGDLLRSAGFQDIHVRPDLDGRDRVVGGEKPPDAVESGL